MSRAADALQKHGYTQIRKVGEGSFGCAILVQHKSDKENDLKAIVKMVDISKASDQENEDALKEAKVLSKLKHPYIVRYRESYMEAGWLCIVMDFCSGGDLCDRIKKDTRSGKRLPQMLVVRWFTQSLLALKYVHDSHILHRDLKSGNFFLNDNDIKIGDFGIARVLESTAACAQTQIGTPYYLSPEICQGKTYAWSSDIWAMGCVLYEMCAGRVPFEAKDLVSLIKKITKGELPELPDEYSDEVKSLFKDCLERDASKRPPAGELLKQHLLQDTVKHLLEEAKVKNQKKPATGAEGTNTSGQKRSGKYGEYAGQYQKSQDVEYYSETHGDWLQAVVVDTDANGRVMLNVKPGVFISLDVQGAKVRPKGAGVEVKDAKQADDPEKQKAAAEEPAAAEADKATKETAAQEKAAAEKLAKEKVDKAANAAAAKDIADRLAPQTAEQEKAAACTAFQPGSNVRLHSLKGAAHLNGEEGTCESWDQDGGRWHVKLSGGDVKAFKAENLEEVSKAALRPGSLVRIHGLKSAAELNGQEAKCGKFDEEGGRWHVEFQSGEKKALKPDNLILIGQGSRPATQASGASGPPSPV